MSLVSNMNGRIAFDKAAIMRRAHHEGRFALAMCRTVAERRQQLSLWLRKAWALAKSEARDLIRAAEIEAGYVWAALAERAREAVALAASFGNDADTIRREIDREHYRQHFNPARIDALRGALATIGA